MAIRKVARDLFFSKNLILRQQVRREFSVFNVFSKKIRGEETERNPEIQEGFKGVKEDLKLRTKQQLYKHVDGVWTEAEAKANKVKDGFGLGKLESTLSIGTSGKDGSKSFGEEKQSPLSKMWEAIKSKMRSHTVSVLKRVTYSIIQIAPIRKILFIITCPPRNKQSFSLPGADDMAILFDEMKLRNPNSYYSECYVLREVQNVVKQVLKDHFNIAEEDKRKLTHHPGIILDKIVYGETDLVMLFKKMYPKNNPKAFSLPEFHREIEKVAKQVLSDHFKKQGVDALLEPERDHQILKGQTTTNQTLRDREVMT